MNEELRQREELGRDFLEVRTIAYSDCEVRMKPDGTGGEKALFHGYASMTGRAYEMQDWMGTWSETVERGAFGKTLGENPDVAFKINHEGMTLARTKSGTLRLSEDETGLETEAELNPKRSDASDLITAIQDGDIDEMSMAFRVSRQEWDEDYIDRHITEVNLQKGDVSAVNYGANPYTSAALRSLRKMGAVSTDRYVAALQELRAGATLSTATMETLKRVLTLVAGADDGVDEAQVVLSQLMGVPNPDDDASASESDSADQKNEANEFSLEYAKARFFALK